MRPAYSREVLAKQQQWQHVFVTGMVMLITDVLRVDSLLNCASFLAILDWLFVI